MAISKAMRAALKALSTPSLDLKKSYQLERKVYEAAHTHLVKPPFYKAWDHHVTCGSHEVPVRIFSLPDGLMHPVLLFFHGGGWVTGDIDSYDKVCSDMARMTNHIVVSVDYRLAPEYPFPAAPEDCYAVARDLYQNAGLLNAKPEQITLIGDSAGGNLAAAVSLMARDRGEFLPARQILLYPSTHNDHTEASPYPSVLENGTDYLLTSKRICDYMDLYLGEHAENGTDPYFAPLLAKDLSNQPRTLVITAEYCPLRDEGEAYAEQLRAAGNQAEICRIPDSLHGFISLSPRYAAVRQAYERINLFLSEVIVP